MSRELINHNTDLQKLVEDGYEVEIRAGHLVLHRIPVRDKPAKGKIRNTGDSHHNQWAGGRATTRPYGLL